MKFTITFRTGSDLARFNSFRNSYEEDEGLRLFNKHVNEDSLTFSAEVLTKAQGAKLFSLLYETEVSFTLSVG